MLRAHVVALVATLTMMSAVIAAQSPADDKLPSFAVASVKPNRSGERNAVTVPLQNNGRYAITNASLELLINFAFQRPSFEIDGMPGWAATEKFDVEARADGTPPAREIFLMLRSLLVDRFKLIARNDTRKMPVYVLVAVKSGQTGPQLRRHIDDSGCLKEPVARGIPDPAKPLPPPLCGGFSGAPNLGRLAAQRIELDRLGQALAGHLGRRVIDRTGPTGPFDLTLEWTPQQPLPLEVRDLVDASPNPDRPSISYRRAGTARSQAGAGLRPHRRGRHRPCGTAHRKMMHPHLKVRDSMRRVG